MGQPRPLLAPWGRYWLLGALECNSFLKRPILAMLPALAAMLQKANIKDLERQAASCKLLMWLSC